MKKESSIEYKQRVMDAISPTFCAAKWYNATIWLDWGQTTSCHHPPPHTIVKKDILKNPAALHNTKEKKEERKLMLEGKRPQGCEYCWKVEDMGPDYVSDRIFKTNIYSEESLKILPTLSPDEDIDLKTLEISFDRKCNFACSYCGPTFSTLWAQDIKKSGPYTNLEDLHGSNFGSDYDHYFPYENSPINPYVIAFWKWWPRLSQSLQELRVTGGEPMLSQDFWELIRFLKKSKRPDMNFAVNSNLGLGQHYISKLIDSSHSIDNFHLYTSCEATGKQAEYIRDGLDFNRFKENLESLAEKGRFKSLNIMMTINALCVFSIVDLFDQILVWKEKYGASHPTFTLNILRFPSFMSVLTLPEHIKEEARNKLQKWLDKHKNHSLILPHEVDSIERLIHYLQKVDRPHAQATPLETAQKDFKKFYTQYDLRRNKSILSVFPKEFGDWYQSLSEE